jgi:hypothetical protein
MVRGRAVLPWVFSTLTLVCSARAEVDDATRGSARQLGYSGVEAFQAGEYQSAHDKLDKAYRVLQAPSLGLWSARALEKLGRLVEASERYLEVTRVSAERGQEAVQLQAQAEARREVEKLLPRIPALRVEVKGADPSSVVLTVDGAVIAPELIAEERPVDPGVHQVEAKRGAEVRTSVIRVREGERKAVTLSFGTAARKPPDSVPPPPPHASESSSGFPAKTLGWVAVIAGGAGLVVGGVTGGMALQKRGEIEDSPHCRAATNECLPNMQSTVDAYDSMRRISTIGFVAGGVLAATGIVLVLTAPDEEKRTAVVLSPRAVSVVRSF